MARRCVASWWPVAILYAALTVLLAYPLSVRPASHVMSAAPDTALSMWALAWDAHAFLHHPLSIFDANIYYPQHRTLAYSENFIGSAVLAAPVLWLTGNPVLAFNMVALASCVLCGLGACLLARRAGVTTAGATLSGMVFAFAPPRFLRLDQLHLATIAWVPFCLAYLQAYLDAGRRADLRLAVAFLTLQALTSGHGVVFLIVAVLALLVYRSARGEPIAIGRRVRDFGLPGALLLAPALLMCLPYLWVQREMGLRRTLENWSVSAASFLASPSHLQVFLFSIVPQARINEMADAYLFPGYLPIVFAVAAVLWRGGTRPGPAPRGVTGFYLLLTLIAVWLSVGAPVSIWPLVYWLPGLNLIRVPSRFMLLALLGLAVLAGIGFDRLTASLAKGRAFTAAAIVGGLLVGEFAAMPLDTEAEAVDIPAIDRWLAGRPAPFAVAEVPLPDPANLGAWERRETTYMLHSMAHWQKTVHGYSGFRPPLSERLLGELVKFPDATSLQSLRELGVDYVVVHTDLYSPDEWTRVEKEIARMSSLLALEHVEGAGRVYAVTADPDSRRRPPGSWSPDSPAP